MNIKRKDIHKNAVDDKIKYARIKIFCSVCHM